MKFNNIHPIEFFYPDLIKMQLVQEGIKDYLGEAVCTKIVMQFSENIPYAEIEGDFEDIISELVFNESEVIKSLIGDGGNGAFSIDIMGLGPLYWIDAQEFDPIQFFKTFEDAFNCAKSTYAPLIEYYEENLDNDET